MCKWGSFLKESVVYPWYKLLSNTGRLWSVFLPLLAHKLMNGIVEESQRLANPIWQRYKKTPVCRYPPWYLFHEEVSKERKIEKQSSKCCYVRINSGNLSFDQYGCFCQRRIIYLQVYLPRFKWARSTLEGWKISACSHLLCSPVFHIRLK